MNNGRSGWSTVWGVTAAAAVAAATIIALFAGYMLGHFAHPKTKTIVLQVAPGGGTFSGGVSAISSANLGSRSSEGSHPPSSPHANAGTAGGASSSGGGTPSAVTLAAGKQQFTHTCASCHTLSEAGTTGTVGPNLDQLKPNMATVLHQVTHGGGGMPAFGNQLSKTQIQAVAKYVSTVAGTGDKKAGSS